MASKAHQIVIIGAGFAGVWAAFGAAATRQAGDAEREIEITVVAPGEDLLIRPRLYERDLRGVRVPLYTLLPQLRVNHIDAMAAQILVSRSELRLVGIGHDRRIRFDQLVICAGSRRWQPLQGHSNHGVDDLTEAVALRAALERHPGRRLRVAVVGSNFTGLEIAAELAAEADVHLIEQADRVAPEFGPQAREVIEQALRSLNVDVHRNLPAELGENGRLELPDGHELGVDLTVWATGPYAGSIGSELGIVHDERGRLPVDETLSTEIDGVWAAGDCARAYVDGEHLATMSCQHAMPMGARAGANAVRKALGLRAERHSQPFYVTCVDLGAAGALLTAGFERDEILATGDSAKQFKRYLNRSVIYPPVHDQQALLRLGNAEPGTASAATAQRLALRSSLVRRALTARAPDRVLEHLTT